LLKQLKITPSFVTCVFFKTEQKAKDYINY